MLVWHRKIARAISKTYWAQTSETPCKHCNPMYIRKMESVLANQITIMASVSYMGYNLLQLGRAYRWMVERVENYHQLLKEEELNPSHLARLHLGLLLFFSSGYLLLLYFAGFRNWVLAVFAVKFMVGGILSQNLQTRILQGRPYRPLHHALVKMDAGINLALVSLVLASTFL